MLIATAPHCSQRLTIQGEAVAIERFSSGSRSSCALRPGTRCPQGNRFRSAFSDVTAKVNHTFRFSRPYATLASRVESSTG
jgi:hypothetical protein